MSEHSFNIFVAKNYGINEAIFIQNMVFWTRTNASNETNYHESRYWAFGTPEFFSKYFPYFKPRLIKDIIRSCLNQGILIKGNFNKKGYDKTNWYSLSDKILSELNLSKTCLQPATDLIGRKTSNGSDGLRPMDRTDYVQPIPDTKPDNINNARENEQNSKKELKPIEYPETYYSTSNEAIEKINDEKMILEMIQVNPFGISELLIRTWFQSQKQKGKPITSGIWALMISDLYKYAESGLDPKESFETMVKKGWDCLNIKLALKFDSRKDNNGEKESFGYINSGFLNNG